MKDKTNFFSNTSSSESDTVMVLDNYKGLPDSAYFRVLNTLFNLQDISKKVLKAHSGEISPDFDMEDCIGMTNEEIATLVYCDDLDNFDYTEATEVMNNLLLGVYCKGNYSTDIFIEGIHDTLDIFKALTQRIYAAKPIEFDTRYRTNLEKAFYNINYCILANFKLLYYRDNKEVYAGVKYYCTVKEIDINPFLDEMLQVYKEHKPTLSYMNKHPELFTILEQYNPMSLLLDLVAYSDIVTEKEWCQLLPDSNGNVHKYVDSEFLEELEDRYRDEQAKDIVDTSGGDNNVD